MHAYIFLFYLDIYWFLIIIMMNLQKNSTSFVIFIQQPHSKFEGQEFQAC